MERVNVKNGGLYRSPAERWEAGRAIFEKSSEASRRKRLAVIRGDCRFLRLIRLMSGLDGVVNFTRHGRFLSQSLQTVLGQ
jgi:hypothetical protein